MLNQEGSLEQKLYKRFRSINSSVGSMYGFECYVWMKDSLNSTLDLLKMECLLYTYTSNKRRI